MDKEGFSGNDGRTTIFDYWSIDTLVRAAQRKLTAGEKRLCNIYNKVMTIAGSEQAVTKGVSFDLMYVNGHLYRQYAFLRKAGSEVLLVVTNFDEIERTVDVTIPAHAFDYLRLKEKTAQAVDLLTDAKQKLPLCRDGAVTLALPPSGALILKFKA